MLSEELTREILGAAMEVHRVLGPGFLEPIYRNALCHELHLRGLAFRTEAEVQVSYKACTVGRHRLDLIVEDKVIVELKAVSTIIDIHLAQALSYMNATGMEISLVLNFGERSLTWKRSVKSRI